MKKLLALVCLFVLTIGASACGSTEKTLIVGMECAYAPFNWTETKKSETNVSIIGTNQYAEGYDVQIARLIANELGYKVQIRALDWKGLIPSLQAGTIDLVIAGMSPTEERKVDIDFTNPYYVSEHVVVCKKTNDLAKIDDVSKLKGFAVVGQAGTLYETIALGIDGNTASSNLYKGTVPEILADLNANLIDGTVLELPVAKGVLAADSTLTLVQFASGKGFVVDPDDKVVSIGVAKERKDGLLAKVNEALAKITEEKRVEIMETAVNNQSAE